MYKLRLYDSERTYLCDWPWRATSLPSLVIWTGNDKPRYFTPNPASLEAAYGLEAGPPPEDVEIVECEYHEVLGIAEIGRL